MCIDFDVFNYQSMLIPLIYGLYKYFGDKYTSTGILFGKSLSQYLDVLWPNMILAVATQQINCIIC